MMPGKPEKPFVHPCSFAIMTLAQLFVAGLQQPTTVTSLATLGAGLHQLSLEYFNGGGPATIILTVTDLTTGADASSSFVHDPAGPCNADCAPGGCNTAQQYCMACVVSANVPVGGVCTSPLSVM